MQAHLAGARPQPGGGISSDASTGVASRSERLAAASVAALIGLAAIFGVGFSHIPALHNAAHDTRHSMAFPCH